MKATIHITDFKVALRL